MLQIIKAVCVLLEAVIPDKMAEMWSQLGRESDLHSLKLEEMMVPIAGGQELRKPKLFEHVEV